MSACTRSAIMRHGRPNAIAENKADDHAYQKLHKFKLSRQKKGAGRWWARPPDRVFLKGFGDAVSICWHRFPSPHLKIHKPKNLDEGPNVVRHSELSATERYRSAPHHPPHPVGSHQEPSPGCPLRDGSLLFSVSLVKFGGPPTDRAGWPWRLDRDASDGGCGGTGRCNGAPPRGINGNSGRDVPARDFRSSLR